MVFYVKDRILYKDRSDLQTSTCNVEALWIEITLPRTKPILLGTVYRPPDSKADYIKNLDLIFQNCTTLYDDVIVVGILI